MIKNDSKMKHDTLSERERKLIKALLDGQDYTGAMLKAGYSQKTACSSQARVRNRPRVRRALVEAYFNKGLYLTDEELALIGKNRRDLDTVGDCKKHSVLVGTR